MAVSVATVTSAPTSQPVTATGAYGPRDQIPLAFKIGGVIARVNVNEAQVVRKGQLLASLDLREIDAILAKAKVAVEKAERDLARVKRLAVDSVATLVQVQDATSALDAARADLAAAHVNREYATIIAPENGIVLQRTATAGSTVAAGALVMQLGGDARGRVLRAGLPDRDILRVHIGDAASVTFDAVPSRSFRGRVSLLGRSADARTGTYAAEITLLGADALPVGLVGRVVIATKSNTLAAMISVDALLEADADSALVHVLSSGNEPIAQLRRVHIIQLNGDAAAIVGLDVNARVVTRGAPYVTPGAKVRIVSDAALTASAPGQP